MIIKNARLLDGAIVHIVVKNCKITEVARLGEESFDRIATTTCGEVKIIDAAGKMALPPLWNMHTHAGMTLFRGYGEDLRLMDWLQNYIWPAEAKLNDELVYHGTRLACLEMIKSGTVGFMDMYWHTGGALMAVQEMGMRAVLCPAIFDNFDRAERGRAKDRVQRELSAMAGAGPKIIPGVGPHAVYTVSPELLKWSFKLADGKMSYHIHVSETEFEVDKCVDRYGMRPVEYLDSLGVLGNNVFAAHSCWLQENEMEIYAKRGVKAVTNPVSNLKLASGAICPVRDLRAAGVDVLIGTDGCSSNNNLDMFEEMKFTAVLQKHLHLDPTALTASEVLDMASKNPAGTLGLDYGIKVGADADIMLVDTNIAQAVPMTDPISNLVYSMNGSCVDTMICAGDILMQNRKVPGEEAILKEAQIAAVKLLEHPAPKGGSLGG